MGLAILCGGNGISANVNRTGESVMTSNSYYFGINGEIKPLIFG